MGGQLAVEVRDKTSIVAVRLARRTSSRTNRAIGLIETSSSHILLKVL